MVPCWPQDRYVKNSSVKTNAGFCGENCQFKYIVRNARGYYACLGTRGSPNHNDN